MAVVLGMVLAQGLPGWTASGLALDFATDPMRGYALGGRDAVAYFTERRPVEGLDDYEFSWSGTVWVFRNEGNRAAFAKAPEVYAPAFTGCDPHALAGGFAVIGNPAIFAIHRSRLMIFHSDINRFLFLADPAAALAAAEANKDRLGCVP